VPTRTTPPPPQTAGALPRRAARMVRVGWAAAVCLGCGVLCAGRRSLLFFENLTRNLHLNTEFSLHMHGAQSEAKCRAPTPSPWLKMAKKP
jgi:hypothetical protein